MRDCLLFSYLISTFDCIYKVNWITYITGDDLDKGFVMIKLTINREGNRKTL